MNYTISNTEEVTMKTTRTFKSLCLALLAVVVFAQFTAFGQDDDAKRGGFGQGGFRIQRQVDQLVQLAHAQSDDAYHEYEQRSSDTRYGTQAVIDNLYRTQAFTASVDLFQRMVGERRSERDLRQALTYLMSQSYTGSRSNEIRTTLQNIQQALRNNGNGRFPGNGGNPGGFPGNNSGQLRWTGRVDAEVNIYIQNGTARTQTIAGAQTFGEQFSFTNALPRVPVTVSVNKLRGRGQVDVIQQPSRQNGFTAIVRIVDRDGGSGDYDFQLNW